MTDEAISLNDKALDLVPGGARSLASQMDRIREDRIITLRENDADRTFSLYALSEDSYLIEDISGDFEMAEDLVWWAAIGRALVRRMENNGLIVKRFSPFEKPPEDAAEVVQCSWDGEVMGRLVIEMPDAPPPQRKPKEAPVLEAAPAETEAAAEADPKPSSLQKEKEPAPAAVESPKPAKKPANRRAAATTAPAAATEVPAEDKPADSTGKDIPAEVKEDDEAGIPKGDGVRAASEPPLESPQNRVADSIRKNEARTAYGAKSRRAEGKTQKTAAPRAAKGRDSAKAEAGEPEAAAKPPPAREIAIDPAPLPAAVVPVISPVRVRGEDDGFPDRRRRPADERTRSGRTGKTHKDN
jgi:hypothetical protein